MVSNIISITILILVVRLLVRLTSSTEVEREVINSKNKVNKLVTASHIVLTLALSITQTLSFYA